MAKGYVRFGESRPCQCRCSYSGPKAKFLCEACLHVCKAPWDGSPHCPAGHGPMRNMGDKWRPPRKAKRTVPSLLPYQRGWPSAGEVLLAKIAEKT